MKPNPFFNLTADDRELLTDSLRGRKGWLMERLNLHEDMAEEAEDAGDAHRTDHHRTIIRLAKAELKRCYEIIDALTDLSSPLEPPTTSNQPDFHFEH